MIDYFYVFFCRRLERRFDLFHCTGSSKRNSTADESCVFVVGKTTFFVLESKADPLPRSRNRQRKNTSGRDLKVFMIPRQTFN